MVATVIGAAGQMPRRNVTAVGTLDRMLAIGAAVLLLVVGIALARGHAEWSRVPPLIWAHLLTIAVALALTPTMMVRPRGDRVHRRLGIVWVGAMIATAVLSLFIHESGPGRFSPIHLLSAWVLVQVPLIWWTARTHRVERHRRAVRGTVIGALLIAGFFTFPFGRLLGHWLFA